VTSPKSEHVNEDCSSGELFSLLDDEYARAILIATSKRPMSANTLSEECDASLPTVYRRVERLVDCDLLAERTEIVEDGHHYSVYEARLQRLTIDLSDGDLHVSVEEQQPEDIADRFTTMWEEI
jgi:Fe2+ or Zn2+ uptake regulation protein